MNERKRMTALEVRDAADKLAGKITRPWRVMVCLGTLAILAGGFWISIHLGSFSWFARAGAVTTAWGLLHTAASHYVAVVGWRRTATNTTEAQWLEHHGFVSEDFIAALDRKMFPIGLAVSAAGTIIWGFGDLLG